MTEPRDHGEVKRTPVPGAMSPEADGATKEAAVPEARSSEAGGRASEARTGPLAQAHAGKSSRGESLAGGLLASSKALSLIHISEPTRPY